MSVIGWEYYDGFTREGTSRDERWLRIGKGRFRLEARGLAFCVWFWRWTFSASVEHMDDD